MPRTPDGKVDMNAPARRTADGKPDLSGFWMPVEAVKHLLNLAADLKPGEVPLQPWAEARLQGTHREQREGSSRRALLALGHPREEQHPGRPQGRADAGRDDLPARVTHDLPADLHRWPAAPEERTADLDGYSIGHWEGDTFIVETIGQNGKTWLDMRGLPGTESLRVIERFTRPNIGRININVTIDDPKAYTKPWDVQLAWRLVPDTDLIESICEENNKDLPHMVGK